MSCYIPVQQNITKPESRIGVLLDIATFVNHNLVLFYFARSKSKHLHYGGTLMELRSSI